MRHTDPMRSRLAAGRARAPLRAFRLSHIQAVRIDAATRLRITRNRALFG